MKIRSFEFNLRELAGSMGDFGTLLPIAIGYIAICGMDPGGLLVMMGLANIATGLLYRLPMPIEPMKALAVVAITQHWNPSLIYASGFTMGIVWILLSLLGIMDRIARMTPNAVVRGIQVSLGVLLATEGVKLLSTWWIIGTVSVAIVFLLRKNKYAPAAIVLVLLGVAIMFLKGQFRNVALPQLTLPPITSFRPIELWESLVQAGFAQIPLTATNAVIATAALIPQYWPDRRVSERQLSLSHGFMNCVFPFFGGMPMCHGAGGLAGQYYFGARTGGTNIIEGVIEIAMGLFFAASITSIFSAFPKAIIGAMMLLVGIELMKFARNLQMNKDLAPLCVTVAGALIANMAVGFGAGIIVYYLFPDRGKCSADTQ